jgi:hypothetical protein
MNEIWKPLPIASDKYEVSSLGKVRSITRTVQTGRNYAERQILGKVLKHQINYRGYAIIALSLDGKTKTFTIHQLVALTHIPNFIKGTEINHIDGNKENNSLINLEVSNPSHNQLHAIATGLKPKPGLTSEYRNVTFLSNPAAKNKWAVCVNHKGNRSYGWKTFFTEIEAAKYADELLDSIGDTQRPRNFP